MTADSLKFSGELSLTELGLGPGRTICRGLPQAHVSEGIAETTLWCLYETAI
jgi:hypothetical protein